MNYCTVSTPVYKRKSYTITSGKVIFLRWTLFWPGFWDTVSDWKSKRTNEQGTRSGHCRFWKWKVQARSCELPSSIRSWLNLKRNLDTFKIHPSPGESCAMGARFSRMLRKSRKIGPNIEVVQTFWLWQLSYLCRKYISVHQTNLLNRFCTRISHTIQLQTMTRISICQSCFVS